MRTLRFIPLVLALGACSSHGGFTAPTPEYSLEQAGDSIPLYPGQLTIVEGLRLTFVRVASDSRCPSDVQCVWAGDAVVEIASDPPCYPACKAASILLSLHTNLEPRAGEYWGFVIRLVALQPIPISTRTIPPSSYVAWVRVTK